MQLLMMHPAMTTTEQLSPSLPVSSLPWLSLAGHNHGGEDNSKLGLGAVQLPWSPTHLWSSGVKDASNFAEVLLPEEVLLLCGVF